MSPLPVALAGAPAGTRVRRATGEDITALVALLADDPLGGTREGDELEPYR